VKVVKMARKKRERIEKHKHSLGEVLEDPETYGVRVSRWSELFLKLWIILM